MVYYRILSSITVYSKTLSVCSNILQYWILGPDRLGEVHITFEKYPDSHTGPCTDIVDAESLWDVQLRGLGGLGFRV